MTDFSQNHTQKNPNQWMKVLWIAGGIGLVFLISIYLSWISSGFKSIDQWLPFLVALVVGIIMLLVGWWTIRELDAPSWLAYLLIGATLLRLTMGVLWYVSLPVAGYDSPAERKGYVMADAYNRDRAAWQFSLSEKPAWKLISGIQTFKKYDQYGGMLFISSMMYRMADGEKHQPLIMVIITASASAVAILFAWAFGKIAFGDKVAQLAAWGLALYPEAILLGSSQMREAFLITLMMAAFYGLLQYLTTHAWRYLAWVIIALLLSLPFSPPATILALTMLVIFAFIVGDYIILRQYRLWLLFIILAGLAFIGIWIAWRGYAPERISDPLSLLAWWLRISAQMQIRLSRLDSGWLQRTFSSIPNWSHFPFMLIYGVLRPLLPAALIDITSKPLWHLIAIWRATGWTLTLPLLAYAPILCLRKPNTGQERFFVIAQGLSLVVWLGILAASLRGGADLWDNPRYRAMFAGIQILLASWVWVHYRQEKDVWMERTIIIALIIILWLVPWYLQRYTIVPWPIDSLFATIGLGVVCSGLYLAWDIFRISRGIKR